VGKRSINTRSRISRREHKDGSDLIKRCAAVRTRSSRSNQLAVVVQSCRRIPVGQGARSSSLNSGANNTFSGSTLELRCRGGAKTLDMLFDFASAVRHAPMPSLAGAERIRLLGSSRDQNQFRCVRGIARRSSTEPSSDSSSRLCLCVTSRCANDDQLFKREALEDLKLRRAGQALLDWLSEPLLVPVWRPQASLQKLSEM